MYPKPHTLSIPLPFPLLQLAEFESDPVVVGDRRYVARLLSYPTVCVKREFLDAAVAGLLLEQRSVSPSLSSA